MPDMLRANRGARREVPASLLGHATRCLPRQGDATMTGEIVGGVGFYLLVGFLMVGSVIQLGDVRAQGWAAGIWLGWPLYPRMVFHMPDRGLPRLGCPTGVVG